MLLKSRGYVIGTLKRTIAVVECQSVQVDDQHGHKSSCLLPIAFLDSNPLSLSVGIRGIIERRLDVVRRKHN